MIAKVLTAAITLGLTLVVARHLADRRERAKAKVRADEANRRVTRLRRDPETGVYHPVD